MSKIAGMALTATLALGGCVTGSGTVYHIDDPYLFLSHAATRPGGVPVMVVGDPYPGRRADVEAVAVSAPQSAYPGLASAFRAIPPADGDNTTKVVLLFNPAGNASAASVCRAPATASAGTAPSGATTNVGGFYCGVGPYSEAWLTSPTPSGPTAPEFRHQIATLLMHAVPRYRNPAREHNNNNSTIP